jgi:peptide/nickel transport system substrate-binding protein
MRLQVVSAFVAVVMSGFFAAGCGGSDGEGEATGTFVVNLASAPVTLDAPLVTGYPEHGFVGNFYATLVRWGSELLPGAPEGVTAIQRDDKTIVPYLAESYEISDDGKTLTFKLRPGLKFSTGRPLDSAAVKASFDRALHLGATAVYYATAGQPDLKPVYETPDPLTFVIRLNRREPLMIHAIAAPSLGIVDVKEVDEHGGDEEDVEAGRVVANKWIATHVAGAGPYLLKEYRPGARMVLEANPDFVLGPELPLEKKVIVNFIPNASTLLLQAKNGAADVTWGLPKQAVKSLKGNPCCNVLSVESHVFQLIGLPNKVPPFDNVEFREALTYAVPYQELVEEVAAGYGTAFYGLYAPALPGYKPELGQQREFDLEKAKALIAESGVQLPVNTELMIVEGNFDQEQIATTVQEAWSKIGVNIRIRKVPDSVYSSTDGIFGDNKIPLIRQDGAAVQDPVWAMDYDVRCSDGEPGFANVQDYCNDKVDTLIEKLHLTTDEDDREMYLDEINKIWTSESPRIQVYAEDFLYVLDDDVTRFRYESADHTGPMAIFEWGRGE